MGEAAIDAFARFGKGMGHGARLNIADCLTYAAARELGQPILYKGNDFAATDLA
jgi:ribonuclease VapC